MLFSLPQCVYAAAAARTLSLFASSDTDAVVSSAGKCGQNHSTFLPLLSDNFNQIHLTLEDKQIQNIILFKYIHNLF